MRARGFFLSACIAGGACGKSTEAPQVLKATAVEGPTVDAGDGLVQVRPRPRRAASECDPPEDYSTKPPRPFDARATAAALNTLVAEARHCAQSPDGSPADLTLSITYDPNGGPVEVTSDGDVRWATCAKAAICEPGVSYSPPFPGDADLTLRATFNPPSAPTEVEVLPSNRRAIRPSAWGTL